MNQIEIANKIIQSVEKKISKYLKNKDDRQINSGNVAVCIIDSEGNVCGKMFGDDQIKKRDTFQTAWRKASQVWITGIASGRFEEMVYSKQIEWYKYGIMKPDYIGWEGGLPVQIGGKHLLSAAFSGFRGEKDVEILQETLKEIL